MKNFLVSIIVGSLISFNAFAMNEKPIIQTELKSNTSSASQDKVVKKSPVAGSIFISFKTFHGNKSITGGGYLIIPASPVAAGHKFPVVIIMHGSRGVTDEHEYAYARELTKINVASFVIDSYTPRGIIATHADQQQISMSDMLHDAFTALETLGTHPEIDITRAGLLGFSKGAIVSYMAAINAKRSEMKIDSQKKFAAHYLFYPGCALYYYDNTTTGSPMTMFLGEKDTYTGVQPCLDLADTLKQKGADIKTIIYKNAVHAWDIPGEKSYPEAEIFKDCRFVQQPNGKWNELKSGIKDMSGLSGRLYEKALKGCLTYGTVTYENPEASKQSMKDFLELVRQQLFK